jgi:hypothetical protein
MRSPLLIARAEEQMRVIMRREATRRKIFILIQAAIQLKVDINLSDGGG